ncbi:MAG: 2,4-dihydroxyhept-2-ene,7-dioic acid aldolase [Planctomycetaceae bacterium]|nr:2,4-dihydroxyhept-2-ene,7-dioic acid aldolase [Planctomycetaceae bacterium]
MSGEFRARLKRGEKLLGTMVTLASPVAAEILASVGFDWLFVDGEHGPLDCGDILGILQAADHRVACVVRVPAGDEVAIKKVLDLGASGVIVPQVNTAEQAADVVRFSRYAPLGARGVGLARAHGYGMRFQEYMESANEQVAVVVQAEHAIAADNIESIVQVPGVDAVLLGPYDLSASLGHTGKLDHPSVVAAIDHITKTCQAAKMPLGYFGVNAAAVKPFIDRGYTLIVAGVDTLMLGAGAKRLLADMQAPTTT